MATSEELAAAQRAIVAALAQHASHNYRASSGVVTRINAEIDRLAIELVAELGDRLEALTTAEIQAFLAGKYTTSNLKALKATVDGWVVALNQSIQAEWISSATALAGYEASYASNLMAQALEGVAQAGVTAAQAYKAAMEQPVLGQLVKTMLSGIAEDTKVRMFSSIRQGISSGQTNVEVVRALRGSQVFKYQDGLLQITKTDASRVVRTARNHVANVAYEQTYQALGVKFVVWCSTLDGRTSKVCASRDGMRYRVDEAHPSPPAHPNCRSVLAPSFDGDLIGNRPYVRALKVRGGYRINEEGNREARAANFRSIGDMTKKQRDKAGLEVGQVAAGTNYAKWFGNQDAAFQREWLGPARYDLYQKGGYSLERFVDPTGKQYTLDQLRVRDEETFKEIFGERH
jgi:SPP1 gp7 family putative phage head morphogenesis protein